MNEKKYNFNFANKKSNIFYQGVYQQAIDQFGLDCYYMPLQNYTNKLDTLLQEVKNKNYKSMFGMRMLSDDQTMLAGAGDIFSKFGLTIQDEITLFITRQEFYNRIQGERNPMHSGIEIDSEISIEDSDDETVRPKISDLVYVPFWQSMFEVSYVEHKEYMILSGEAFWKLICKKHTMESSEHIDLDATGIENVMDVDAEKIGDIIDDIKELDTDKRDERQGIIMDPDETGFDEGSTPDIINDDIEANAVDDKGDDSDYFGDW